jgi:hypothetical protein
MPILSFPSAPATRRRRAQQQQQPTRVWLNRQQQQQGYSEYQHGQAAPATSADPQHVGSAGPNPSYTRIFRSTP